MKQGNFLITFVIGAISVALAIYFGIYAYNTFSDPYQTTTVYTYTAHDSVELDGLLIREELVLPPQNGIVELTRAEGERVGVGQNVALVYRDSQAQADQAQLEALELEIELLEYAIGQGGDVASAARLDEDILQSIVGLRASAALSDYSELEDQVLSVKSGVLKRGYVYGDGLTSGQLTQQLRDLNDQRASLRQRSAAATIQVAAPRAGVFSNLVDGYESLLTLDSALQLTPASLRELMARPEEQAAGGTGKLITSRHWEYAATLPDLQAQRLREGDTATLRFTGDFSRDVDMEVALIGPSEEGRTLVIFSCNRYMSQTTLLRRQAVELIFDSWTGLRIPKSALRLVEAPLDDPEGGASSTYNRMGVYAMVAGRTEFKEVELIKEGSDYYVVRPVGTGRKILRAGDKIVTQATGLQDGLLLEY